MIRIFKWAFAVARLKYLWAVKRGLMARCGPWELQQEVSSLIMRWTARERQWRDWSASEGLFVRIGRAWVNDPETMVATVFCGIAFGLAVMSAIGWIEW